MGALICTYVNLSGLELSSQQHFMIANSPFGYVAIGCVFILMISVLVFAHEFGHYLFARLFGMGVEEFAVGFGKTPLFVYAKKNYITEVGIGEDAYAVQAQEAQQLLANRIALRLEGTPEPSVPVLEELDGKKIIRETTLFTVRPWPLGGFVRIKGMVPEEDGSETRIPGGFYSKAPWKRFLVLLAGPMFSVLAGIAILVPVYMIGGIDRPDPSPVIGNLNPGSAAAMAGLKIGDRIMSINGTPTHVFFDVLKIVRDSSDRPLKFEIDRKGHSLTFQVTPKLDSEPTPVIDANLNLTADVARQGKIGAVWQFIKIYPSLGGALVEAMAAPVETVQGIAAVFAKPVRFGQTVSGPVAMVEMTSNAMQQGVLQVMFLMAMLSISVGVFNLLPVPPLDGGQMAFALAEMLRGGRRLSLQVQSMVTAAGLMMVLVLVGGVMYSDFKRRSARSEAHIPTPPTITAKDSKIR